MQHGLRITAAALALLVALSSVAQAKTQEELKQSLEKKLAKPFLKNAAWVQDYDEAKKQAKAQNKLIFAYFTRSYSP